MVDGLFVGGGGGGFIEEEESGDVVAGVVADPAECFGDDLGGFDPELVVFGTAVAHAEVEYAGVWGKAFEHGVEFLLGGGELDGVGEQEIDAGGGEAFGVVAPSFGALGMESGGDAGAEPLDVRGVLGEVAADAVGFPGFALFGGGVFQGDSVFFFEGLLGVGAVAACVAAVADALEAVAGHIGVGVEGE